MIPLARPIIGKAEREAADRVLQSGMLAQGPEVAAFEAEFSEWVDGRECVAVSSGTAALHLALLAAGVEPGDEVIVPSFTFAATANAVALCGALPVFADIDPETYCLSPEAAESVVSSRTTAIMPVHLYGHPADMIRLGDLARKQGLILIEDAAQAHGARLGETPCGAFGDAAIFSFYPTKNMTTGEGGMIVTPDGNIARIARLLRNQGMEHRYQNEIVGFNYRMTDLAAAIGRAQLVQLPGWTRTRQANAAVLNQGLTRVSSPDPPQDIEHVYHQYTVRCEDRDRLLAHLTERGIGAAVYYPIPVHRLPPFDRDLDLPETVRAAAEVLSLPVHPSLTDEDLCLVVAAVEEF